MSRKERETFVSDRRSKLYEMVDDPSKDSIVSWSESGKSFIVWDDVEFRRAIGLPGGCLGYLGFSLSHKSHEQLEYTCPYFIRGQPDLLKRPSQDETDNDNEGLDSSNEGLVPFSSLSCYKEMWRRYKKERPASSSNRRPRPLFLREVYDMVDDPSTDSVVSWSESGKSFIVWNESEFLGDVLPSRLPYYVYKDMTSLTTSLRASGYTRVEESEHWEYTANYLVRGQPPPPKSTSPSRYEQFMVTPEFARILERHSRNK
ncbi:unnamed protein product [Eruca vesicaria subsp. sativa]|uniref:HSF-type DNA-binding domain-containing protein n=1 Tax=Eruca vesicaria subsp. sativa TaxID=29727 RepID=A0ABC8L609_ERUVS|nr:unnamed protein product [Eruca vesicaria subsp. sativa]